MEELCRKIIHDHKNPIVKINLPAAKLFKRNFTPEEDLFASQHLEGLQKVVENLRVEKRCARAQAVWLPENLAKVTKLVKSLLKSFGYQNPDGVFLLPEEMLFLLETNKLEVLGDNNVPLSIKDGYDLVHLAGFSLLEYTVYKKLALLGYRLLRREEMAKRLDKLKGKRQLEDASLPETSKKRKVEEPSKILDLLAKIRESGPKAFTPTRSCKEPDYLVFLPSNTNRTKHDLNLFICNDLELLEESYPEDVPNIFAISTKDNVAFYRISSVILPVNL